MFHGHFKCFSKPPFGGRPNTKLEDHGTPNAHNHWFILFYHVWRPAWMKIQWNSIRLRTQSHMTSHYTWGSVTTLHDFGGVLRQPLSTFFWAPTISWSQLSARGCSGPKPHATTCKAQSHNRGQECDDHIKLQHPHSHPTIYNHSNLVKSILTTVWQCHTPPKHPHYLVLRAHSLVGQPLVLP
jgi:hypothetical protein